ncbi:PAS fold-containing protein [Halorubrum aquaticum]|uniref:histidine kinase n=1 Tax=Halorubrum aquaticum TaxID=387340 RepID=A0A1I3BXY5_9EURY|nr:ATP-binding protein [Halorubrum aquaticum]SFH67157.1 PAS fold-containing protein [Halorubrum aquaticum]
MSDPPSAVDPETDLRTVLDRMADGFFAVDDDWRVTYANERGAEMIRDAMADGEGGVTEADGAGDAIEGTHLWEAIPEAVDTEFYDRFHRAMETQESASFDEYYPPLDTWFDVRAFPSDSGLSVHVRDVTERHDLERQRRRNLRAIQRLYAVSSDGDRSFEAKLEAIFELGCEYLELPNGFLTRIEDGTQHIQASHATHPALERGETCPLEEAYCKRTVELDRLLTVVDAANEGWEEEPAYERFGLGTYIGGRVEIDGELSGTLCFADTDARKEPFSDLQKTFVELLTRWVSYELERERTQAQLQRERDRLEEFASVVSHDLRNPLNTAAGHLELLAAESDSEHVEPVQRSLSRMETLIEDLLALARDGVRVEALAEIGLAELVSDAWSTAETADAELTVELDRTRIRADESRLRQLLENLFRNAVEHGGDDVSVRVGTLGDASGFYVEDDGPGIPEDDCERAFEAGYSTSDEGTGFGLSIVEEIVAAHDWTVTAGESESGGARFEIDGVEFAEGTDAGSEESGEDAFGGG